MSEGRSIVLEPDAAATADHLVASGEYASTEAAVEAGLALLAARVQKAADLRAAIEAGIKSGAPRSVDREAFFRRVKAKPANTRP